MIPPPMKYAAIALLLFWCSFTPHHFTYRTIPNNSFKTGESIEFRVHYGLVNAGYGSVRILPFTEKMNGREVYHVIGKGRSASSFDWFFKVRDEYHSFIDVEAMAPIRYTKDQHEGGYNDNDAATFDHEKKLVNATKGVVSMPEYTQDVISLLYYARTLNVRDAAVGATFPITFYLDKQITTISLKILGRETIKTDLGKFKAIKIRPQVIADRVFKDENAMTLWVTDDANLIPLRIQAELAVGSIKADITACSNIRNNNDALIAQ